MHIQLIVDRFLHLWNDRSKMYKTIGIIEDAFRASVIAHSDKFACISEIYE